MSVRSTGTKLLATIAVVAVAISLFTVSSLALFADQEDVGGNTFSTGTIDLTASPASAVVTMGAMEPSDQVTAPLTISNSGSLDFRYSMVSTTTEDTLAAELELTIKSGVTTCDDTNWPTDGTVLYTGQLGSSATMDVLGSDAQGAQAGDRLLSAGANEVLCFNVTLPLSAGTSTQGLSTTATFTFSAEQTASNP